MVRGKKNPKNTKVKVDNKIHNGKNNQTQSSRIDEGS